MKKLASLLRLTAMLLAAIEVPLAAAQPAKLPPVAPGLTIDREGTVRPPALIVPFSDFASAQAKTALIEHVKFLAQLPADAAISDQRRRFSENLQPALKRAQAMYSVVASAQKINGVGCEVFSPTTGVQPRNERRVLINLHGGGFTLGAGIVGALESIPVASLGNIKVVSVDYRQGPENRFPAASEDVSAVYEELLKQYPAGNIGIYGCSAGGMLTAEAVAWIAKRGLPAPGAIGIFCAGAGWSTGGDSSHLGFPLMGMPQAPTSTPAYFATANLKDPLVSPMYSSQMLSAFPPTLILTSTRDILMSPAVYTHTQLVKLGVDAELHVWEGLDHGFFTIYPELPETREAWDVVVKFFSKHLGH